MQVFTKRYANIFPLNSDNIKFFSQYSDLLETEFGSMSKNLQDFSDFVRNLLVTFDYETSIQEKTSFKRQISKQALISLRGEFQEMYFMLSTNIENFAFNKSLATHGFLQKEVGS